MIDIEKFVKALRGKLNLTQQELADKMDVDVISISRWERKKQRPRPIHIRKMLRLERRAK